MAVGPELVVACAHSLSALWREEKKADEVAISSRGRVLKKRSCDSVAEDLVRVKKVCNRIYWLQPNIVFDKDGYSSTAERIPICLVAYNISNDWALFLRTDGEQFKVWAEVDTRLGADKSAQASVLYRHITVYHCPVALLDQAAESGTEYTLSCQIHQSLVQSQTAHHLRYNGGGTSRGSSGGAVHMHGCKRILGWHCEALTENSFHNHFAVPDLPMEEDEFHRKSEAAVFPPPESAECDAAKRRRTNLEPIDHIENMSEAMASSAGGNSCQGSASIISRHPRLLYYIGFFNANSNWTLRKFVPVYKPQFDAIAVNGVVSGDAAKKILDDSGLPAATLTGIWDLADMDRDGSLDLREFVIAKYMIEWVHRGGVLPADLDSEMVPPGKVQV